MNHKVSIVSCDKYENNLVAKAVRASIDMIGSIEQFVSSGQRVLIKPNLLSPASPERAITTHPTVVEAVVKIVQEVGGIPFIADSPGSGIPHTEKRLKKLYEATGMLEVAERAGISTISDPTASEVSFPDGIVIKRLEVIQPLLEADVVINLPKLKTHVYTIFTGATKNLFGIVPGYAKPGYHAKLYSLPHFADMLLDIIAYVKPAFTLMDGVVGLEGDGPGTGGHPRDVGIILAGADCVALDVVVCSVIGLEPTRVPTLIAAQRREWWDGKPESIEVVGKTIDEVRLNDYKMPETLSDPAGFLENRWYSAIVRSLAKSAFTPRPFPNEKRCTACGTCVRACPRNAITIENKVAIVDDKLCIRCYCCHELCPEAAIDLKISWFGSLMKKMGVMGRTGRRKVKIED